MTVAEQLLDLGRWAAENLDDARLIEMSRRAGEVYAAHLEEMSAAAGAVHDMYRRAR